MDNSLVVELIARRMDNDALDLMSQTSLWSIISPLLTKQEFWYNRASLLVNFDLKWDPLENWKQVYNILLVASESNPFSEELKTRVLSNNEFNITAIKLLLRLGHNPSVHKNISLVRAAEVGAYEAVELLLSISDVDSQSIREVFGQAVIHNYLEVYRLVRQEPAIDVNLLDSALRGAIKHGSVDVLKLILQDPRTDAFISRRNLMPYAMESEHVEVVKILLDDPRIRIRDGVDLINTAVSVDDAQTVLLLLSHPLFQESLKIRPLDIPRNINLQEQFFIEACGEGSINVAETLLEGGEVSIKKVGHLCLKSAFWSRDGDEIITLLMSHREASILEDEATNLLESFSMPSHHDTEDISANLDALISSKNTNLEHISSSAMKNIVTLFTEYISDSISGCIALSGRSMRDITNILIQKCDSFKECHYSMLLREIILKGLDLKYYLEWILKHLRRSSTSSKIKRIFSSIARSLSGEDSPVHTSDFFTAYRGFFLLAISDDRRIIMNTLKQEEATRKGLDLAGGLIGAFLGKKRL